ncbi:hypothetical protein FB565_002944 [Actinoplanes lutulentus]|uniref:hypothetical protein n=1 Tax=Actinoplanes lutulentus TaxID=1287878 RepID=UPI0015ECAD1B|nr:hypothetical protein [Actinoplanes lutulentus]MBB2943231.1 hypothetical protein [Actinoplanes lutulentus]
MKQVRRWEFVWIRLLVANPLDAAEDFPPLRVPDRVEEQTGVGASNARIGSHPHSEAMMEIDGRAPATARVDDDYFCRLPAQRFNVREINGQ